jgi:hypothetical protein
VSGVEDAKVQPTDRLDRSPAILALLLVCRPLLLLLACWLLLPLLACRLLLACWSLLLLLRLLLLLLPLLLLLLLPTWRPLLLPLLLRPWAGGRAVGVRVGAKCIQGSVLAPNSSRLQGSKAVRVTRELASEVQHLGPDVLLECPVSLRGTGDNITIEQEDSAPMHALPDVVLEGAHTPCSQALHYRCRQIEHECMLAQPRATSCGQVCRKAHLPLQQVLQRQPHLRDRGAAAARTP